MDTTTTRHLHHHFAGLTDAEVTRRRDDAEARLADVDLDLTEAEFRAAQLAADEADEELAHRAHVDAEAVRPR